EPRPDLEHEVETIGREIDERREHEALGRARRALEPPPRLLVEDALVRRVLVDHDEPAAHRGEDVLMMELPQLRLFGRRRTRRERRGRLRRRALAGARLGLWRARRLES